MFDDPDSLRTTARRYRGAASQTSDRDVIHVFNAVADQYELKAAALEIERQNGTILRAWDSLRSTPSMDGAARAAGFRHDVRPLQSAG
jgi:hypothetical protein